MLTLQVAVYFQLLVYSSIEIAIERYYRLLLYEFTLMQAAKKEPKFGVKKLLEKESQVGMGLYKVKKHGTDENTGRLSYYRKTLEKRLKIVYIRCIVRQQICGLAF